MSKIRVFVCGFQTMPKEYNSNEFKKHWTQVHVESTLHLFAVFPNSPYWGCDVDTNPISTINRYSALIPDHHYIIQVPTEKEMVRMIEEKHSIYQLTETMARHELEQRKRAVAIEIEKIKIKRQERMDRLLTPTCIEKCYQTVFRLFQ